MDLVGNCLDLENVVQTSFNSVATGCAGFRDFGFGKFVENQRMNGWQAISQVPNTLISDLYRYIACFYTLISAY